MVTLVVISPFSADVSCYRDEPDGRGTFGILKSCVVTLVLSIYTALHLNIQPGNASTLSLCLRKAKWIIVGIFAPEIIVFVAWGQKRRVNALSRDLPEIFAKHVGLTASGCSPMLSHRLVLFVNVATSKDRERFIYQAEV